MTTLTTTTRRGLLAGVVLGLLPSATGCSSRASGPDQRTGQQAVTSSLAGLGHRFDVRLGAYARDTGTGAELGYRADDRFPMCSTYKVLAAAAVLNRSISGTKEHLCEAAVRYSDNAAANSLLEELGGPAGVTAYARSLGDHVTRLDRTEPTLNQALPGDPRDTTSPRAIATDYDAILLRTAISPANRALITGWLKDSKTGPTESGRRTRRMDSGRQNRHRRLRHRQRRRDPVAATTVTDHPGNHVHPFNPGRTPRQHPRSHRRKNGPRFTRGPPHVPTSRRSQTARRTGPLPRRRLAKWSNARRAAWLRRRRGCAPPPS